MKHLNKKLFSYLLFILLGTLLLPFILVPFYIKNSEAAEAVKEQPSMDCSLDYTKEGIQQVVEANNKFGVDLYLQLAKEKRDRTTSFLRSVYLWRWQ